MSRDILLPQIDADPSQPRKFFDEAALAELAQSLAANGLIVPILVRPLGDRFIIVHGERRYRAAQSLGWETLPAEVRDIPPEEAQWFALVENVQRADLSPIEEARAYRAVLDTGITQTALGKRIGKTQSYIAQKLRLLSMPDPIQFFLDQKALTEGHARELLQLKRMYGDELTWTMIPGSLDNKEDKPIPPDIWVLTLSIALRVEDKLGCIYTENPSEVDLLYSGCMAFRDYVVSHDHTIPLWALASFYWAMLVIHDSVSVADLRTLIDQWYERFISSIGWYTLTKEWPINTDKPQSPIDEMASIMWYAVMSDLRHGRILEYEEQHGAIPDALQSAGVKLIASQEGATALPSQLQPWGEQGRYERYQELSAIVAARSA